MDTDRYSWALGAPTTNPFAHPRGLRGRLAGLAMQWRNARSCREVADGLPLRPGQRVLEVGFGPGVLLAGLAARPEAPALLGVDPSPVMLARARRRVPDARLELGTAAATGLPDGAVDHVVSVNTVALWPDLDAGLDELCRVTRNTVTLAWHRGPGARSRTSRGLGLPAEALAAIADGLGRRFRTVDRRTLTDVVLFRGS